MFFFYASIPFPPIYNQSIPIYLSIGIDNRYQSITTRIFAIDWSSIININRLIDIDWYRLISIVIDYRFHRLDTPGFTHVKPVLGYVRAHEKFRDSSMPGWRRYFGISNEWWRPKLKRKCPLARPKYACIAGYVTLEFDVYLTPRAWFPFWTQPKITSSNTLWSAAAITAGVATFTLHCTSFKTITTILWALQAKENSW